LQLGAFTAASVAAAIEHGRGNASERLSDERDRIAVEV
jgi:hypothetical protein